MKKYFILDNDPDMGTCLCLVTEDDYNNGYNASLNSEVMDDNLYDTLDELACYELQDGIFEVQGDVDEIRTTLTNLGLEEKPLQD